MTCPNPILRCVTRKSSSVLYESPLARLRFLPPGKPILVYFYGYLKYITGLVLAGLELSVPRERRILPAYVMREHKILDDKHSYVIILTIVKMYNC